jgi:hypothetical protein
MHLNKRVLIYARLVLHQTQTTRNVSLVQLEQTNHQQTKQAVLLVLKVATQQQEPHNVCNVLDSSINHHKIKQVA